MSNPKFLAPLVATNSATQYKANIDASVAANGSDAVNLGFSYASGTGTFTVHDAQGNALSSTNPAFVRFQDPDNPGYNKYISVEANQNFIDDAGSSEIVGNLFGLTTSVAHADAIPFFLYAVSNDAMDTVQFMISRVPHATSSPAVGDIGAPDDAVADANYSFWSLDNIDETLYDTNPCTCVGSFRMVMSASDDWTVQTLSVSDGIGQFQEGVIFTQSTGQFGNTSGNHILTNSGTAPTFSAPELVYTISRNGDIRVNVELSGDGGTDGSGARNLLIGLPFADAGISTGGTGTTGGSFTIRKVAGSYEMAIAFFRDAANEDSYTPDADVNTIALLRYNDLLYELEDFTDGSRVIRGTLTYKISLAG